MDTFKKNLDQKLLCSFGWSEVENLVRERCLEAVEQSSMDPLLQPIDMDWRNGKCCMNVATVKKRLEEKGIWQLVESEIEKKK